MLPVAKAGAPKGGPAKAGKKAPPFKVKPKAKPKGK
jgi:hypothetical protein